jgi:hypothetical protein
MQPEVRVQASGQLGRLGTRVALEVVGDSPVVTVNSQPIAWLERPMLLHAS